MKLIFRYIFLLILINAKIFAGEITIPTNKVEIGDTFLVELRVPLKDFVNNWDWEKEIQEPLELYKVLNNDTINEDLILKAVLIAFEEGNIAVGPFEQVGKWKADAKSVEVALLDVDTTKAFMDIQEVEKLEFWWGDYLYVVFFIIALIILLILWVLWKKYKKKREEAMIINKANAHVWALNELEKIKKLIIENKEENALKSYFEQLSHIFKQYLSYRYNWNSLEETSEEVLSKIKKENDFRRFRKETKSLLNTSDLVKFAKANVIEEELQRQWNNLKEIVESTKFKEEEY
ncbi:MAG TPA: DUF4381 family protein [Chitinophagaceae bacterium]|nr:DUF4381 family protein [Chitinophagaceae bacterium]